LALSKRPVGSGNEIGLSPQVGLRRKLHSTFSRYEVALSNALIGDWNFLYLYIISRLEDVTSFILLCTNLAIVQHKPFTAVFN